MQTTKALQDFLDDDQILEVAELASNKRSLEAARLLQYFLIEKWNISTIDAVSMVKKIALDFSE